MKATDFTTWGFGEPKCPGTCEWVFDIEVVCIMEDCDWLAVLGDNIVVIVLVVTAPALRRNRYGVERHGGFGVCCDSGHCVKLE